MEDLTDHEVWDPWSKSFIQFSGHPVDSIDKDYYYFYDKVEATSLLIPTMGPPIYRKNYATIDYDNELYWISQAEQIIINLLNFESVNKSKTK